MAVTGRKTFGKVRIIGGDWRGTKLAVSAQSTLRPSPNRLRETLFNWLNVRIRGAYCLDLFAGSGVLGLEALSRGATKLVCIEKHAETARQLQEQVCRLKATERTMVICADCYHWISQAERGFDLCFLDPPFNDVHLDRCLALIAQYQIMKKNAMVYVESPAHGTLNAPSHWVLYRQVRYGAVCGTLYTC